MTTSGEAKNDALLVRRRAAVPKGPFHVTQIFVDRAEGARLWDVEGREYIDFCGGIGVMNVGHNHPEVVAAIKAQADKYLHVCFHVTMYEPYIAVAERLNRLAPVARPCKSVLLNSGAEAVENAIKLARAFTKRPAVVAMERGFHGRTLLGMTLTGKCHPYTAGFGPFAPEVYRLPYAPFYADQRPGDEAEVKAACREALDHLVAYHVDVAAIACIILEPVLGEGGFMPVHPAALALLRAWCDAHGVLLVADEVQSGFGRCGAMFACDRYGVTADLVTMAKSLAGGMVLSAVTGRAEVMDAPDIGGIGGTYGGNPVSCAAAVASIDVIEKERLSDRAQTIGERVRGRFSELQARHPWVGPVRGLGAMCSLSLVNPDTGAPDPDRARRVCAGALERGVLLMTASGHILRTLMPLVITDDELTRALDAIAQAVAAAQ